MRRSKSSTKSSGPAAQLVTSPNGNVSPVSTLPGRAFHENHSIPILELEQAQVADDDDSDSSRITQASGDRAQPSLSRWHFVWTRRIEGNVEGSQMIAPFQSHSPTSKAAARKIMPKLNVLQQNVLLQLMYDGPMTDEELQRSTGLSGDTERPRRVSLCALGLVRDSGQKRKTSSGRAATVWEAV